MSNLSGVKVDAFMLPDYNVPDAHPSTIANDSREAVIEYKIPLVVWMFIFLIVGYIGLRAIMED
jgi:hypothetical protein